MNDLNKIQTQANRASAASERRLWSGRQTKKRHAAAGGAIFVFIVLHFVSQIVFFRNEISSQEITSVEVIVEENAEIEPRIETEYKTEESVKSVAPGAVSPILTEPKRKVLPASAPKKKELPRETRAERLRRAEKILTGV